MEDEPDKIKVAVMTLAFNNREIIMKLKDRGEAIEDMDWEKVHKIEQEIIDFKN